jgi:hypothetical protein
MTKKKKNQKTTLSIGTTISFQSLVKKSLSFKLNDNKVETISGEFAFKSGS